MGCRRREPRSQLLRLVLDVVGGTPSVRPDIAGRLPGRGAWIHPRAHCLELAQRRRAFGRAFRTSAAIDTIDVSAVLAHLQREAANEESPIRGGSDDHEDRKRV
ncbi:MAG: YlxR family protein [Dermatophilus congolensis]|nr:YlxR family protein [Dermatophilus congolensis]